MKKMQFIYMVLIIIGISISQFAHASEKLGLMIIAHGSPAPLWNTPVLELEKEVSDLISNQSYNPFHTIRVALMEFNEPSINTVIEDMEKIGIDKVYVIPLFIAPSGHSLYDIPTILGLYSDEEMLKKIREEETAIVDTKMKIIIGPTLNKGDVLKKIMLDRVKEQSKAPESESVVLLAHGDTHFKPIWDSMCREIGYHICAETGISCFDYAFVEIGQSFISEGVPVILKAAEKRDKTIVIGLYLAMGVENMAGRFSFSGNKTEMKLKEIFTDKNVFLGGRGLLPDKRISEWIVDRAMEWAK